MSVCLSHHNSDVQINKLLKVKNIKMHAIARARPSQRQGPGIPFGSPTWVARMKGLVPSSATLRHIIMPELEMQSS